MLNPAYTNTIKASKPYFFLFPGNKRLY